MTAPTVDRPGKELPKIWRDLANDLLAHEGWRYERRAKHPRLFSPNGESCSLPTTVTDGDAGHRASYITALRRIGAPIDRDGRVVQPERPQTVSTPVFSDHMGHSLAVADVNPISTLGAWWHPAPEPEPAPVPVPVPAPAPVAVEPRYKPRSLTPARQTTDADARGEAWTLAQARTMLRQGYHVNKVVQRTGWGLNWFRDMIDTNGFLAQDSVMPAVAF